MSTSEFEGRRRGKPTPSLQYFVLAAVDAGLATSYDLNARAGLSVAATLPLLTKLKAFGLMQSEHGFRRSERFRLTTRGRRLLEKGWRQLLDTVPLEYEAVLRTAYIAAHLDPDLSTVRNYLKKASEARRQVATEKARLGSSLESASDKPSSFGHGHLWLRAVSEADRFRAEAATLRRLAGRRDLAAILSDRSRS